MNATYGFLIDETKCSGCHACAITCKDKNMMDAGYNLRKVTTTEEGMFPKVSITYSSSSCHNCANPLCVDTCPADAIMQDKMYGVPTIDAAKCTGCGNCTTPKKGGCPYEVPVVVVVKDEKDMKSERKIAKKCDFCIDLLKKGQQPACVAACIARALEFGKVEDLLKKHPNAVLMDTGMNSPVATLYIKKSAMPVDTRTKFSKKQDMKIAEKLNKIVDEKFGVK